MSIIKPESAFVWGGSYYIPVFHGLLDKRIILMRYGYLLHIKEESFAREYMSINFTVESTIKLSNCWKLLRAA